MFQAGMFPRQKKSFFFLVANHFRSMTIRSYSLTSNAAQKEKKEKKKKQKNSGDLGAAKIDGISRFRPIAAFIHERHRVFTWLAPHRFPYLKKKKDIFFSFLFLIRYQSWLANQFSQGFPFAVLGNVPHQLIESSILHGWSMADDGKSEFNHLESRKNPHWQIESMGAAIT